MLTGILPSAPAFATEAAEDGEQAEPGPTEESNTGFSEIIVTATRQAENIQKVPISIQALGAATLEQRQVKGLSDFAALLPSVSFAGLSPGRNTPYFRGIVPAGGNYASVGYYLDDIPITGTNLPDIHVYDLERIEALSGPQGTLYGAGSLAGTIRFITQKPKIGVLEYGYDVEANKYGPGDFGGQLQGYINVPVTDTLALRGMAFYRRDGGYVDNTPNNGVFNDGRSSTLQLGDNNPATSFTLDNSAIAEDDYNPVESFGVRVQAMWEPLEGWTINPQLSAQHQVAEGYFGFDPRLGDLEVHDYDVTEYDDKWYQAALSINGQIGDWDIVSSTGYFQRKIRVLNDYTYYTVTYDGFGPGYENYLQFFDPSGCTGSGATLRCTTLLNPTQYYRGRRLEDKFTQELRITTPKSWPFDVTVGGFYQYQKNEINNNYATRGLADIVGYTQAGGGDSNPAGFGIPVANGGTMILGSPAVKGEAFFLSELDQEFKDTAIFAEGHYNITPTLKITAGIRYFWTEFATKGFSGVMASAASTSTSLFVPTGTFGCPVPLPDERLQCLNSNPLAADQTGRYEEDGETHKIALDWQVDPDKLIYANYSTGFRPGGYNRPLRIRGRTGFFQAPALQSETLTNYEIGVKTTWSNIFRFNAALYYEEWSNIQFSVVVAGAQGSGITGNAGNARVYGLEYDAELKLGKVTLATSGAYNNAKLNGNFCNFAVVPDTGQISQLPSCTLGETVPGSAPPTPQVAAADGTRLPRQPEFKGTTSIRYDTQLGDMDAYVLGAALYQTNATQNLNEFNNALLGNTDGFISFDLSGGLKQDNWSVDLFIQNVFDRRGELTRNTFCSITFCSGSARTFTIRPQFFGIRYGQKF